MDDENKIYFTDDELQAQALQDAIEEAEEEALVDALIEDVEELESLIDDDAAELSAELRPYVIAEDVYEDMDENATLSNKFSNLIAGSVGSWTFIIIFVVGMMLWMALNMRLGSNAPDPFPFILLNLALSTLAGLQAPVILMSQNRQSEKDRALARNDYEVNLKAELQIADLHRKVDELSDMVNLQSRMINALLNTKRDELRLTLKDAEQKRHNEMLMPIETGMS